ncbi:MAG: zinc-ribbon domain-containing protein [Ruminococcus sp.]|nr:zinc-ribbon domain-containing protein [Ruminococcus sp.]
MAFCRKCGKEIDDEAVMCVHCGVPTDLYKKDTKQEQRNSDNMTLKEESNLWKERDPGMLKVALGLEILAFVGLMLGMFVSFLFYPLLSLPIFIYSFVIMSRGYKKNGASLMLTFLILGIILFCINLLLVI